MRNDLHAALGRLHDARTSALALMEDCIAAAASPAAAHAFIRNDFVAARAAALAADRHRAEGGDAGALGGLAVSVKDLFDVAGLPTTAGSSLLAGDPPATRDAPAVARLRAAGAALIGKTNLSEFAFSGVGLNPHHGTPANAATAAIDPVPRIPGGSTSGGAVSVATGAAWAALGSDTGGSIRIPAALQGLVGFKSTARLVPTDGAIPLSTTLDTACAITRSVRDAALLHAVLAGLPLATLGRPPRSLRLAVAGTLMQDGLEDDVARAFERALRTLSGAGATIETIPLAPLGELAGLNAAGTFSEAESWSWHRRRLLANESAYDPRVARRIRRGERMSAADYIDLVRARRDWIGRMEAAIGPFDAVLSPTVPIVAPPLAPLGADDDAFFATNGRLLRNPSAINFLDGCAISLPCHREGEMPVGLMIWSGALRDADVLAVAAAIEGALDVAGTAAGRHGPR